MKRREIEAEISRLNRALESVIEGGTGITLLLEFAKGEGTGYRAYAKAKETIEALIVKAKAQLATLPEESAFEKAKRGYYEDGDWNMETKAYIVALEKCRPWVVKSKAEGKLLRSLWHPHGLLMFPTREEAVPYCDASTYEVVQWEGDQ